jgi:hypothetical protein
MLTDKDFEDIGKRLYDLEADPPKKGWERIAADMVPPPSGVGKKTFLGRHWWKGLLIILPISVFLIWPENETPRKETGHAGIVSQMEDGSNSHDVITENNGSDSPSSGSRGINDSDVPNVGSATTPIAGASGRTNTSNGIDTGQANGADEISVPPVEQDAAIRGGVTENYPSHHKHSNKVDRSVAPEENDVPLDALVQLRDTDNDSKAGIANDGGNGYLSSQDSGLEVKTSPLQESAGNDNSIRHGHQANPSVVGVPPNRTAQSIDDAQDNSAEVGQSTLAAFKESKPDPQRSIADGDESSESVVHPNSRKPAVIDQPAQLMTEPDSIKNEGAISSKAQQDPDSADEPGYDKEAQQTSTWRITAAVSPQFSYKSITPVGNDEVLVTNIRSRSGYPERAGFAFAVGAGKEIFRNLYLDAQLTYARTSQTIDFSSATGKIDTLLAVQGGDGNVRIVPVYQVTDREQKSTLGYGGIRITATHYFWSKGKRRFNISAGAGLNRMVSNAFEEKINGSWVRFDDLPLSKTNYHFTLGAGYSVAFGNGWELMFTPMLTHYLKKIQSNQQPFHLAHRSYGLNIMLSKSLK